jgi:hypothetical protein
VTVAGKPAAFAQPAELHHELGITPAAPLAAAAEFTVVVRYSGVSRSVTDPDGSVEGWGPTVDVAFVVDEPQGSPSRYLCNDTLATRPASTSRACADGADRDRPRSSRRHRHCERAHHLPVEPAAAHVDVSGLRHNRGSFRSRRERRRPGFPA